MYAFKDAVKWLLVKLLNVITVNGISHLMWLWVMLSATYCDQISKVLFIKLQKMTTYHIILVLMWSHLATSTILQ